MQMRGLKIQLHCLCCHNNISGDDDHPYEPNRRPLLLTLRLPMNNLSDNENLTEHIG